GMRARRELLAVKHFNVAAAVKRLPCIRAHRYATRVPQNPHFILVRRRRPSRKREADSRESDALPTFAYPIRRSLRSRDWIARIGSSRPRIARDGSSAHPRRPPRSLAKTAAASFAPYCPVLSPVPLENDPMRRLHRSLYLPITISLVVSVASKAGALPRR